MSLGLGAVAAAFHRAPAPAVVSGAVQEKHHFLYMSNRMMFLVINRKTPGNSGIDKFNEMTYIILYMLVSSAQLEIHYRSRKGINNET
ncbi:MAG: hypothetical protein WBV22_03055 [Anaerolineaceae bacterium]